MSSTFNKKQIKNKQLFFKNKKSLLIKSVKPEGINNQIFFGLLGTARFFLFT